MEKVKAKRKEGGTELLGKGQRKQEAREGSRQKKLWRKTEVGAKGK